MERLTKEQLRKALVPDAYPDDVNDAYFALDVILKDIWYATTVADKLPCPPLTDEYPPDLRDTPYCEPSSKRMDAKVKKVVEEKTWTELPGGFANLEIKGKYSCSCPLPNNKKAYFKFDSYDDGRNYVRERCIDGQANDIVSLEMARTYDEGYAPKPNAISIAWKQFDKARNGSIKDKVLAMDKVLHSAHDRGALASQLVEGGQKTLNELAGH